MAGSRELDLEIVEHDIETTGTTNRELKGYFLSTFIFDA